MTVLTAIFLIIFLVIGMLVPGTDRLLYRRRKDPYRINDSAEYLASLATAKAGKKPDLTKVNTPTGEYIPGPDDPLIPKIILGDGFVDAQSAVSRHSSSAEDKPLVIPEDSVR
jgi:hypothetical protein